MLPERDTIRRIREAVASGRIGETFRAADVNAALKIEFSGVFLHSRATYRRQTHRAKVDFAQLPCI